MFPEVDLKREDIESSRAGLRSLIHEEGKVPSEISRKDEIFVSSSGFTSIAGAKLIGKQLNVEGNQRFHHYKQKNYNFWWESRRICEIKNYVERKTATEMELGLKGDTARKLIERYDSNIKIIFYIHKRVNMEL